MREHEEFQVHQQFYEANYGLELSKEVIILPD